jgi:hypothetical protein
MTLPSVCKSDFREVIQVWIRLKPVKNLLPALFKPIAD